MQLRHVWSRQYRHSQMNQNGPLWQTWHVHSIRVLSDLIMTNECAQWLWLASAIFCLSSRFRRVESVGTQEYQGTGGWAEAKAGLADIGVLRAHLKKEKAPSLWRVSAEKRAGE
jgi:hypothetical protein